MKLSITTGLLTFVIGNYLVDKVSAETSVSYPLFAVNYKEYDSRIKEKKR